MLLRKLGPSRARVLRCLSSCPIAKQPEGVEQAVVGLRGLGLGETVVVGGSGWLEIEGSGCCNRLDTRTSKPLNLTTP